MTSLVLTHVDNGIATITLNDPTQRNPISDLPMVNALIDVISEADTNPEVRVMILTGAGKAFSSGGNIKTMLKSGGLADPQPVKTPRNYRQGIQRIPLLFNTLETPIIAAVNGHAIGAGCDLACMCDIRIANESAKFSESFVNVGLIPGDGGAWLLQRIVGFSKAAEMAFTGELLTAQEALNCGLVSRVVPDEQLLPEATALARKISKNPPHAVQMTKRLLIEGRDSSLSSLLELASTMQALMHTTQDHKEALQAFVEKREAQFTGD